MTRSRNLPIENTRRYDTMVINASSLSYQALNKAVRSAGGECRIENCLGQRFIGAGLSDCRISIGGIPGNALGAYLNGASIQVDGNAQDAVGDTMNAGTIVVHGSVGDAAGYAMRGGTIYIRDDAGYRAGVHMKAYADRRPVMVIGGRAGSFLGEYQAGGIIVVLGLHPGPQPIVGNFPCTGMHGGKVFLRSACGDVLFPAQVTARPAAPEDLEEIRAELEAFGHLFGENPAELLNTPFTVVTPDSSTPYRQMYVAN